MCSHRAPLLCSALRSFFSFSFSLQHLNNVGQFRAVNIVPIPQLAVMDDEEVTDKLMLSRAPDILAEPHVMQRVLRRQGSIRPMGGSAAAISIANRHLIVRNGKRQSMYARNPTTPIVESEHESADREADSTRDTLNADAERQVKRELKPTGLDDEELEDDPRVNLRVDPALHSPAGQSPSPPPSAALRPSQIELSVRRAANAPTPLRTPGSARSGGASQSEMSVVVLHGTSDSSSSDYDDAVESPDNSDAAAVARGGQGSLSQAERHTRKMARREQRRLRKEAAARAAEDAADEELRSRDHDESGSDRGRLLVSSGPTRLVRSLSGRNVAAPRSTKTPSPLMRSRSYKLASGSASTTRLEQLAALAEAADEADHAENSRTLSPAMGALALNNAAFPRSGLHAQTGEQAATAIPRPSGPSSAIRPLTRQRSSPLGANRRASPSVGPPPASALHLPAHLQPVMPELLRHYSNDAAAELELELQLASLGDASERPPAPSPPTDTATAADDRKVNGADPPHAHQGAGST